MRLQTRLALTTCLLIVPVIVMLVVSVGSVAHDRIYNAVDETLETKAASIRSVITVAPEGLSAAAMEASLPRLDRQAAQGTSFSLVAQDGTLLYSSAGADPVPTPTGPPIDAESMRSPSKATYELDGVKTRLHREPFYAFGRVLGYIEVRESLLSADEAVGDIRRALLVGGGGATLAIILSVYWLAGQVVAPVRKMSELSSNIQATGDFSSRLPETQSPREVRELTTTFNGMLQRIQDMVAAQKAFFAESSHELRRPLTILRTNLDLLGVPDLPADVRTRVQEQSRDEAAAMSDLIAELLILSRSELTKAEPSVVDLSVIARRSLLEFREYCRDHSVEEAVEDEVLVLGDKGGLKHVIDNLLENAHFYTPPEGRIVVGVSRAAEGALVTVRDSGPGMSTSELGHAFDRFFRGEAGLQSGSEGFGLGLAIVKHVAESHAGTVLLSSRSGEGTTCTVTIPLLSST